MLTAQITSKDINIGVLRELVGDVTEVHPQSVELQSTRNIGDPAITAALIGAGTATLSVVLEKIVEHVLLVRRQRLEEQLRTEITEIKFVIEADGKKIEVIEKFPSDHNFTDKLKTGILSQLEMTKPDDNIVADITVLNDLL